MSYSRIVGVSMVVAPLWHLCSFADALFITLGAFTLVFTL